VAPEKPAFRRDDELEQLAKVVENALVEGHTESLKALEKRLSALAQAASSYVRGKYGKLESTSESGLQFLSADQEVMHTQTPTGSPSIGKKLSAREIENVLSKIEFEGVYQLPEAQLDRFVMKLAVGYPSDRDEVAILRNRIQRKRDEFSVNMIVDAEAVTKMQDAIEAVHGDDDLLNYISQIVRETRLHPHVEVGASPRGSLALLKLARANAALNSRDYIIPDDVKDIAIEALSHRIIPKASSWVRGFDAKRLIEEILNRVPVPRVD
jgi:hypothetical protein